VSGGRVTVVTGASAGIGARWRAHWRPPVCGVMLGCAASITTRYRVQRDPGARWGADFVSGYARRDADRASDRGRCRPLRTLDALVKENAAMGRLGRRRGRVEEVAPILETNLLGTLIACRAALR